MMRGSFGIIPKIYRNSGSRNVQKYNKPVGNHSETFVSGLSSVSTFLGQDSKIVKLCSLSSKSSTNKNAIFYLKRTISTNGLWVCSFVVAVGKTRKPETPWRFATWLFLRLISGIMKGKTLCYWRNFESVQGRRGNQVPCRQRPMKRKNPRPR